MTTYNDLLARARTYVRDSSAAFIDEGDFLSWANEAVIDLAARLHIFDQEVSSTTTATTITLPPSTYPALLSVEYLSIDGDEVAFTDNSNFDEYVRDAVTLDMTIGYVFNNTIRLYPEPATGTAYVLRYKYIPDTSDTGAETVPLPMQLERKVVAYMVAMAQVKLGDDPSAMFAIYEQGLPNVDLGKMPYFVTPITLQADPNYFELDPEAKL